MMMVMMMRTVVRPSMAGNYPPLEGGCIKSSLKKANVRPSIHRVMDLTCETRQDHRGIMNRS